MADSQPPDPTADAVAAPIGVVQATVTTAETVGTKRQRRPSVRLGDIGGEQLYDSRRTASNSHKQWKKNYHHNQFSVDAKKDVNGLPNKVSSKTRPLTNLSSGGEVIETLDGEKEGNLDSVAIGSWKVKDSKKRGISGITKRVRSKWVFSKSDGGGGGGASGGGGEDRYSGGEDDGEFEMENCVSPLNENSHGDSLENLGDGNERKERESNYYNRRGIRGRDTGRGGEELSGPSDNEGIGCGKNDNRFGGGEDGVRIWLNSIGLGRYAPVFEIHEVDDEVLPQLTLEDLKDMGINAVGSRRKMFSAIQKLSKGFS